MEGGGKSKNLNDYDGKLLSPTPAKSLLTTAEINMGDNRRTNKVHEGLKRQCY